MEDIGIQRPAQKLEVPGRSDQAWRGFQSLDTSIRMMVLGVGAHFLHGGLAMPRFSCC